MDFKNSITAEEVERAIAAPGKAIKEQFPQVKLIFIEAEKDRIEHIPVASII